MVRNPVPEEQVRRIQPVVDDVLERLHALVERLPSNTESALIFELEREDRE